MLVREEDLVCFQVGGYVGVKDMFEDFATYGGEGNRAVVTRSMFDSFLVDGADISIFPVLGADASAIGLGKDEGKDRGDFVCGFFEDSSRE